MTRVSATHAPVSVIIPAYNAEASLNRALDSALGQQPAPVEVIVINDGSTDATAEIARSYGDRIVFLDQTNQGQGAARNAGLRIARGKYIGFLDADDFWRQGFLRSCVSFLENHEDAIAVSCGIIVRLWGKPERRWPPRAENGGVDPEFQPRVLDNFFDFWGRHDHIRTGSNLIRRDVIERIGYQRADLRISQDLEYWGYLATAGKWGLIPDHLWVGDPTPAAALNGWKQKYSQRRALCPTIEQWQARILPRLRPEQMDGFARVRGRIAANYALSKIKSSAPNEAWDMVARFGDDMPNTWSTWLMRLGRWTGRPSRALAIGIIRAREHYKSYRILQAGQNGALQPAPSLDALPGWNPSAEGSK